VLNVGVVGSRAGMAICFGLNFVISGIAFRWWGKSGTTKGAGYSYCQPDAQTFSIWGLIYTLHAVLILRQFCGKETLGGEAMAWLQFNYVTGGLWLFVNGAGVNGFSYWLAVVVLWVNFYSLTRAYSLSEVDYTGEGSFLAKAINFSAISFNIAWAGLAAVLNLSNTLYDAKSSSPVAIGGPDYAIAVVGLALAVGSYFILTRGDFGIAATLIWAFLGIHRNQLSSGQSPLVGNDNLSDMCLGSCVAIAVVYILGRALEFFFVGVAKFESEDEFRFSKL